MYTHKDSPDQNWDVLKPPTDHPCEHKHPVTVVVYDVGKLPGDIKNIKDYGFGNPVDQLVEATKRTSSEIYIYYYKNMLHQVAWNEHHPTLPQLFGIHIIFCKPNKIHCAYMHFKCNLNNMCTYK